MELHGGWIEVTSAVGQGTTATLRFPARGALSARLEAAA
jgi:signal transduction histidine kinase